MTMIKFAYIPLLLLNVGLFASIVSAGEQSSDEDPFAFYKEKEFRALNTVQESEYSGWIDLTILTLSDDNFTFGQYNGLNESGVKGALSGDYTKWMTGASTIDYWQVYANNLGLKTGDFGVALGAVNDFNLSLNYSSFYQANNNTGFTPYSLVGETLHLPTSWQAGLTTKEMSEFYNVSSPFEQSLERNRLGLTYVDELSKQWSINSNYRYESKTGTQLQGAAFYANAQNGHAAILPAPIDYLTHHFDFGVGYHLDNLNLMMSYLYSKFENEQQSLGWQNPYSANLGAGTQYPDALGQLSVAPSNDFHQIRLIGNYIATPTLRFSGDFSYAMAKQNSELLPYTSNASLAGFSANGQTFDGEVNTATAKAKAHYRWNNKLTLQFLSRFEDRSNDSTRQAYQSVFGDTWAPNEAKFQVYNRPYSKTLWLNEIKASYRLPAANKLDASYGFEQIERYNHAVNTTKENQFKIVWRSHYFSQLSSRLTVELNDRVASSYDWQQSYFSLFEQALINETPNNQRFTNHPLMSQYYLSDRQQTMAKWALSYYVNPQWQVNADLYYQNNDYDESVLGLLEDQLAHTTLNASWHLNKSLNLTAYLSYDYYNSVQMGRAFRGGMEKNPFEIYSSLPQASDASRNWRLAPEDITTTLGASAKWLVIDDVLDISADYRWLDSTSEYSSFSSGGAQDLTNLALPNVVSNEHHFSLDAAYHAKRNLTFKVNYQFYQFDGANWANDNVFATSIDKVLGTGETTPDDLIHFISFSVVYHLE